MELEGILFQKSCSTYQYNETNVMHSSFSLLKIKGLYMFRPLLARPQEFLHKRHLSVLSAYNLSWLCQDRSFSAVVAQLTYIIRRQHTK
jgi:hypothetical protein